MYKNIIAVATSSSGNSSGSSTQLNQNNSGSEEDLQLQVLMDQRKRKRMQSNRESARRSRIRKQKHLDDLMAQVAQLRKDNSQILTSINITTQHYMNVEAENSILRAQFMELTQRLHSLNEILDFINTTSTGIFNLDHHHHHHPHDDHFMNNNNTMYLNQPIMASPDMFQNY